ncbi:CK1/WORM6 protein kinase [Loa loa]|uniref:CK1/WORM6 protein kinase n=2 Tax=Loa loa TaxID=7209 RepID=A0A1S0TZW1_LOALO|nr:CK1/WORM6 protein kinase [Loa loa]EFO22981.2 CK1/WORM6 protein kinase [Loa loa]
MSPVFHHKQLLSLKDFPKEGSSFEGKNTSYQVIKLLGKGGFGVVFQVQSSTDNKMYAAKLEAYENSHKVLLMDCLVLRGAEVLKSSHFCKIFELGKVERKFRFIIITMLGPSLHLLRTSQVRNHFSLGTALRFAQQSLEALQDMHSIGFLHRDVKPSNFGVGRPETNDFHIVYIFDFGLARQFATRDKDCRIPRKSAPFRGTPRYASLNSHRKQEQSPKDDIESWFYMIIEWTVGALPWKNFKNQDRDKIMLMKEQSRESAGMKLLLEGCPRPHYRMIMQYIDNLEYTSIPDYGYIYFLLKHVAKKNRIPPDEPLDHDPEHPYAGTETPPSCLPYGVLISTIQTKNTTEDINKK